MSPWISMKTMFLEVSLNPALHLSPPLDHSPVNFAIGSNLSQLVPFNCHSVHCIWQSPLHRTQNLPTTTCTMPWLAYLHPQPDPQYTNFVFLNGFLVLSVRIEMFTHFQLLLTFCSLSLTNVLLHVWRFNPFYLLRYRTKYLAIFPSSINVLQYFCGCLAFSTTTADTSQLDPAAHFQ